MLGSQSWFVALAIPTVTIGGFIATRKRLAYQWKEELMDPDGPAYPAVTDADMGFFRRVAPADSLTSPSSSVAAASGMTEDESMGVAMSAKENIGLAVRSHILPSEVCNVLLNETRRWASLWGTPPDPRIVEALQAKAAAEVVTPQERVNFAFLPKMRMVSDHAEDTQEMGAPWGCGDRMDVAQMPASLRWLVEETKRAFPSLGRLRHVYVEYSPSGKFYHAPRATKAFDGHDYVIIPLRRDGADTIVTYSPLLRSRFGHLCDVVRHSWTSRDVDALIPPGSMLRTYGMARYEWGWGLRPGPAWFGSPRCPVHSPASSPPQRLSWAWWDVVRAKLSRSPPASSPCSTSSLQDAAIVTLHFEGPRSSTKQRSLLLQPEIWIFGRPPTPETYERWVEAKPTVDDIRQVGLVRFILENYFDMLTVS